MSCPPRRMHSICLSRSRAGLLRRITLICKPSLSSAKCPSQTQPSFKLHCSPEERGRSENIRGRRARLPGGRSLFIYNARKTIAAGASRPGSDGTAVLTRRPATVPGWARHVFRTASTAVTFLLNNAQVS